MRKRLGSTHGAMAVLTCFSFVLMFLDSCDPAVAAAWETGITTAVTGLVSVFSTLLTTAVTALLTGIFSDGNGGTTTVQGVHELFQSLSQMAG